MNRRAKVLELHPLEGDAPVDRGALMDGTLDLLRRANERAEVAEAQVKALLVLLECTRGRMEGVEAALAVAMPAEIAPLYAAYRDHLRAGVAHIDRTVAGVHAALLGGPGTGGAAEASPLALAGEGIESGVGVEGSRSAMFAASTPSPAKPRPQRIREAIEAVVGGGA